jgi:predicted XRE-type DNA-binding protein
MNSATVLPIIGTACEHPQMYEKAQLGAALREAMTLKGVRQGDLATEFGIAQSSVSEWLKYGRIAKRHLPHLVAYFSPVVGPDHWGLPADWVGMPGIDPELLRDEGVLELLADLAALRPEKRADAVLAAGAAVARVRYGVKVPAAVGDPGAKLPSAPRHPGPGTAPSKTRAPASRHTVKP